MKTKNQVSEQDNKNRSFHTKKTYRTVQCGTPGQDWLNIEDEDGNLFAVNVPTPIAEDFVRYPDTYGSVFGSIQQLRCVALLDFYKFLYHRKKQ